MKDIWMVIQFLIMSVLGREITIISLKIDGLANPLIMGSVAPRLIDSITFVRISKTI